MNSHKKDRAVRAYNHGFRAGLVGKSMQQCPYESVLDLRGIWMGGWRQGRDRRNWGVTNLRTADISAAIL